MASSGRTKVRKSATIGVEGDPCGTLAVITGCELARLKSRNYAVVTRAERARLLDKAERRKAQLHEESQDRMNSLEKAQLQQKCQPGTKLGIVVEEATHSNAHTLQRALEMRQEQEEDVRKVNSIILATKCMAIREVQLDEKKLMKKELEVEDKRLDAMMEQRRQISINKELAKIEEEKEKGLRYAAGVQQQMKDNEITRIMDAESAEEETRANLRALIETRNREEEKERRKQEDVRRVQEEMKETNKNSERYKQIQLEEERIAEMRVQDFMRMKAEREEERLAEQEVIKLAKERELERLRKVQQQFHDRKSELEEVHHKIQVERVNREWREKEKAAAEVRRHQMETLKSEREKQIEQQKRAQALELENKQNGLGLGDCKDVTVKGLEIIRQCDRVYLEAYTSVLTCGAESLEEFYGRKLLIADRDLVEQGADEILDGSDETDVALLVVGDPFGATTHTDLILRAKERNIGFQVVHNASILNAVGCCGLQLYNFGETVSIPYWTDTWRPDSFFDKIASNHERKLHTLCLLDIKVKEPTLESLTRKRKEYMPPRFMSVQEASQQLLQIVSKRSDAGVTKDVMCVGLARVGSERQKIVACSLEKMAQCDLGDPLHSLIIASSELHPLEAEYVRQFEIFS